MKRINWSRMWLTLLAAIFGALSFAKVVGPRTESLGTAWPRVEYENWLSGQSSLLTPQTTQLALQACFRQSQETLDVTAYAVASQAVAELAKVYRSDRGSWATPEEKAMVELTKLLQDIDALVPGDSYPDRAHYEASCREAVGKRFAASQDALAVLYAGRMHPHVPESLASRGLRLTPLTFETLTDQICKLEGYYSTSRNPSLWKFFSLTRAMMNVLPAESRSEAFVAAARRAPEVAPLLRRIDQYSAIAGKYNGATLSMSAQEAARAPLRLTGPATGSRATSLLAFFTTAWRERLQQITMERPYPAEPFKLISLAETMGALQSQLGERQTHELSATEVGMEEISQSVLSIYGLIRRPLERVYGANTGDFLSTSALAWLALNAETNIRQNEKIPGVEATAIVVRPKVTTLTYGDPRLYQGLAEQIAAARKAYRAVDADGRLTPPCVAGIEGFVQAAQAIPKGEVQRVEDGKTEIFRSVKFEPVIADIGQEVKDDEDGPFRLHLATGYGREIPLAIKGGAEYRGWTPSALVLHLPNLVSTSEWQSGMVNQYDHDNP